MYLLDADVFIRAKNQHYGFDFCPAFWDWLDHANRSDLVFSIEAVLDELKAGEDDLSEWAEARGDNYFLSPDPPVITALRELSEWAMSGQFPQGAVTTFFQAADYYLIAHARAHGHTVVTHERGGATKQIKITDACIAMDVHFMSPFTMLRTERARFTLSDSA